MHTSMCACVHLHECACIRVSLCVCIYMSVHVCMCIHGSVCVSKKATGLTFSSERAEVGSVLPTKGSPQFPLVPTVLSALHKV